MTRECKQDLAMLNEYIKNYSLKNNIDNVTYTNITKAMHKSFFSLVTWHSEILHQQSSNIIMTDDVLVRISEVISDIGTSMFNWLHGSYKSAKIMLRSAIENFIRGLGSIENKELLTEKSTYALFDETKNSNIFNHHKYIKTSYIVLHDKYKELCKDTHTATRINMEHITSLVDYPKFDEDAASVAGGIFIEISKNILIILCSHFNNSYQ